MSNDKVREDFEAWTLSEGGNILRHADDNNRYASATVQGRWRAYQAGREAIAAPGVADGWVMVPAWKGYALLGTGRYLIQHSADFDPELGAELFITLATDEDRTGNRKIGESRPTREPQKPVEADDMVLRIGFLSERALFALEDQLREIRETHFAAPSPTAEQPERPPYCGSGHCSCIECPYAAPVTIKGGNE